MNLQLNEVEEPRAPAEKRFKDLFASGNGREDVNVPSVEHNFVDYDDSSDVGEDPSYMEFVNMMESVEPGNRGLSAASEIATAAYDILEMSEIVHLLGEDYEGAAKVAFVLREARDSLLDVLQSNTNVVNVMEQMAAEYEDEMSHLTEGEDLEEDVGQIDESYAFEPGDLTLHDGSVVQVSEDVAHNLNKVLDATPRKRAMYNLFCRNPKEFEAGVTLASVRGK